MVALNTLELVTRATVNVRGLSARDALRVWHALGSYVSVQLATRRCVRIAGFGVFALGPAQEPVFLHSADFLRANRVRERRSAAIGDASAPIAAVNMSAVAQQHLPGCSKELVASVVASVLALTGSLAKQGHTLRLSWLPMGEWQCDGDIVSLTFLAEFQLQLKLLGRTAGAAKVGQEVRTTPSPETPGTCNDSKERSLSARVVEPAARVLSSAALRAHTKTVAAAPTATARTRSTARVSTDQGSRALAGTQSSLQRSSSVRASSQQQSAPLATNASAHRTAARSGSSRPSDRKSPSVGVASSDALKRFSRAASGDRSVRSAPPSSTRVASMKKTVTAPPSQAWAELRCEA